MLDLFVDVLKEEEGFTRHILPDTRGFFVGHGCRVDEGGPGLSEEAAECDLKLKLESSLEDLITIFPMWWIYGDAQQAALISMHYQLGSSGFRGFRKMIEAIKDMEWDDAARECVDSAAGHNPLTEVRFRRNAEALRTNQWQWGKA